MNLRPPQDQTRIPPAKRSMIAAAIRCMRVSLGLITVSLCSCAGIDVAPNNGLAQRRAANQEQAVKQQTQIAQRPSIARQGIVRIADAPVPDNKTLVSHFANTGNQPGNQPARRKATDFTAADARIALPTDPANEGGAAQGGDFSTYESAAQAYPDEYLFQGGDRGLPIHYDDFSRNGVETEDTIAEYVDDEGKRYVKPTNQIAIYAPRFGAIRSIGSSSSRTSVDRLASTNETTRNARVRNRLSPSRHVQRDTSQGIRVRSRASGLESESVGRVIARAIRVVKHTKLLNAYEDVAFVRSGKIEEADEARLALGMQAAANWSRDINPVITAMDSAANEVYGSSRLEEFVGIEIEHRTKGQLRIIKLADKKIASPGDVITFTIRFDNLGDRELHHIRIVDNLTPRLEYIEDSATSTLAGNIVVEDNEEGSLVLRFEMDAPLKGHSGGVVTFQTKVR